MGEVRSLMIMLLVFSAIIIGMSTFYVDLTSPANLAGYGLNSTQIDAIAPEDLSSRNVTNTLIEQTRDIEEALKQQPTGIGPVDVAWGYINAALSAVTLPLTSVALFTTMLSDISVLFGLPAWFGSIILGIVLFTIIFAIMYAYLKWRF